MVERVAVERVVVERVMVEQVMVERVVVERVMVEWVMVERVMVERVMVEPSCGEPSCHPSQISFAVTHYAGEVMYTASGWLEKNRGALHADLIGIMQQAAILLTTP